MGAVWLRVCSFVRGRGLRLFVTAAVIGLAAGLAMGIVAGTRRTDSAPDRYTRRVGGDPDMVITQLGGRPLTGAVAALPGVSSTKSIAFVPAFLESPLDGTLLEDPNSFVGDDAANGARLVAGRFTDPANPAEFVANRPFADMLTQRFGTHIGDHFEVAGYTQAQVAANFDISDVPGSASFTATLVGITESPSEFDDPSPQIVFSPSFFDAHADVGIVQTFIAVHLDQGGDPAAVLDAVRRLPDGVGAYAVPTRVVSTSARRAVRFQVTALWLVGALAMVAAAVLIAQVVTRNLRVADDERRSMLAIGWRRTDLAVERALEGAALAVVAAPIATGVAWSLSSIFPIGALRSFEPDPGRRIDWLVTLVGAIAAVLVVVASAGLVGWRGVRAMRVRGRVATVSRWSTGERMSFVVGAGLAASGATGRRPWASRIAAAAGIAGVFGAAIVGVTLTRIVDRPPRWGVNYDQLLGNPYVDADRDLVTPIAADPGVAAATGVNIGSVTINGSDTAAFGFAVAKGHLVPTVVKGRDPTTATEIGLGAEVARRLGVEVGDTVDVTGAAAVAQRFLVVGLVVTPDSAGNGAALTFDAYRLLNPTATENVVLVKFRRGTSPDAIDALAAANFTPPGALVQPASVRALERVTAAPILLLIVLTVLLVIGGAYSLAVGVRVRRRDFAVLRALGANSGEVRAVVHWHASLVAAPIIVAGATGGIVLARSVITLLTDALGIVPGVDAPVAMVAAGVGGAFVIANALALLPARRASRIGISELSVNG